jgi:hypothetical protein
MGIKNMIKDLTIKIRKLRTDMESNLPFLENEINSIIKNQEKSHKRIERMLDTLLDYLYMGVGEKQFKMLNSYYESFCPKFSAEYDKLYHETMDE